MTRMRTRRTRASALLATAASLLTWGCAEGIAPPEPTGMVTVKLGLTYVFGSEDLCSGDGDVDVCGLNTPDNLQEVNAWPSVEVEVQPFKIDVHEVTNLQYEFCVAKGACPEPAFVNAVSPAQLEYYGVPRFHRYPVVNVSWPAAETYCKFVGKRLPTEAEWERVAKGNPADGVRLYPAEEMGDSLLKCKQLGLPTQGCSSNGGQDMEPAPARSGDSYSSASNDYVIEDGQRVYHLFGNAAEWVADVYDAEITCADDPPCTPCWACSDSDAACLAECANCAAACGDVPGGPADACHYACLGTPSASIICTKNVVGLPLDGNSLAPSVGSKRVIRGGSVLDGNNQGCQLRSSARDRVGPGAQLDPAVGDTFIGFRCACTLADCPPE